MKNTFVFLLSFLFVLYAHQTFAQTSDATIDSVTLINELSNKLSKSPVYINYVKQVKRVGKLTLKNAGMPKPTDESNRLYNEAMGKVKDDKTLSELERRDSIQSMLLSHYAVPKPEIDSVISFSHNLYKEFPELMALSLASVRNVFFKANASLPPSTDDRATDEKTFTMTEQAATFPGGMVQWKRYLERNLNARVAERDHAPAGLYTVKVQFVVDSRGNIINVVAVDTPEVCPHCGTEAVRIISKGPKWIPAVQNGKNVTYTGIQFITFSSSL